MTTFVCIMIGIWLLGKVDLSNGPGPLVLIFIALIVVGKVLGAIFGGSSDSDASRVADDLARESAARNQRVDDLETMIRRGQADRLTYSERLAYQQSVRDSLRHGENVGSTVRDWYEGDGN